MPKFGERSQRVLGSCCAEIQKVWNFIIEFFDCSAIEGHRTEEVQNEAYATGRSKLKYPQSKHNGFPSDALDSTPYPIKWVSKGVLLKVVNAQASPEEIKTVLNDLLLWYHYAGIVRGVSKAMGYDFRWGGDWDGDFNFSDQTFDDLPHWEVVRKKNKKDKEVEGK